MGKQLGQAKIGLLLIILLFFGLIILTFFRSESKDNKKDSFTGVGKQASSSVHPNEQNGAVKSDKLANNYFVFTQEAYEVARTYRQPVFLFFYDSDSSDCKEQDKIVAETFGSLENNNVIGFRVNFNDNETSQDEEDLAKDFTVSDSLIMIVLDKDGDKTKEFRTKTPAETLTAIFEQVNTDS